MLNIFIFTTNYRYSVSCLYHNCTWVSEEIQGSLLLNKISSKLRKISDPCGKLSNLQSTDTVTAECLLLVYFYFVKKYKGKDNIIIIIYNIYIK